MTEQTKLALINWTGFVTTAIARIQCGKEVDWREIIVMSDPETHNE